MEIKLARMFGEIIRCYDFSYRNSGKNAQIALIFATAISCAGSIVLSLSPLAFKAIVDDFSHGLASSVLSLALTYIALRLVNRICSILSSYVHSVSERRTKRTSFCAVFEQILNLPHKVLLDKRAGEIDRIINDGINSSRSVISNLLLVVIPILFELGTVALVLVTRGIDLIFFSVFSIFTISYGLAFRYGYSRQRAAHRAAATIDSEASGKITEALINHEAIRIFSGESYTVSKIDNALLRSEKAWVNFSRVRAANMLFANAVFITAVALMLLISAHRFDRGLISLGDFVLVNTYLIQAASPIERFGFVLIEINQSFSLVERLSVFLHLDAPRQRALPPPDSTIENTSLYTVEFRNVCFSFDRRRPIIKGISFQVGAGKSLAVVGKSGSGKSTLVKLLLRLYEQTSGEINICGKSIHEISTLQLRKFISIVPQDTILFNDTLYNNISFGQPQSSKFDIEQAIVFSGLEDFVKSLPDGWDTVVGERGLKISGGEKQRVAIARAALRRPKLIIFDEATSALDTMTEKAIYQNMLPKMNGITTIIIAHRLSTIVDANEIIVIEDGKILESGNHEYLLSLKGVYSKMWEEQMTRGGEDLLLDNL